MVVKVPVFLICISNIGLESDKYPPRAQNPSDFINYLVHDYFRWKVLEEIACERHVYGIVTKKIQPLCRGQTERRASREKLSRIRIHIDSNDSCGLDMSAELSQA